MRRRGACVPLNYEICGNALDDNCNGLLEEGCGLEGGRVQFIIAWSAVGADVDLHVVEPGGELIEEEQASRSGLEKPRDCPGRNEECEGVNVENVFLRDAHDMTPGVYRVSIRLESLGAASSPVWVNFSARLGKAVQSYEIQLGEEEQEVLLQLGL